MKFKYKKLIKMKQKINLNNNMQIRKNRLIKITTIVTT